MNRTLVHIFIWLLATMAVVAMLLGGAYAAFSRRFYPSPPTPSSLRPVDALQAQRSDLQHFRALLAMDKAFTPATFAEAIQQIAALESLNSPVSRQMLHVALMKIMALADNGHTQVSIVPDGAEIDVLPVRVTAFADGIYVMRARRAYRDILEGRVLSIDNVPIESVLLQLESLRGGLKGFRHEKAALYVTVQDLLNGLGISPDPGKSVWRILLPSGAEVARTLVAYPLERHESLVDAARWMSPEPIAEMGADWIALSPSVGIHRLPLPLRDFDTPFVRSSIQDNCAAYLRIRAIADEGSQRIGAFLESVAHDLRRDRPCAVIVDLRYNHGGDFLNTYTFMHALPQLVPSSGRLYVLTDALTFSAAITTAAFLKEAGGDRVTILGEPVGDRLTFFAEGNRGCLPNSRLCVDYATGKHDYSRPCSDWNTCFWLNWLRPVRVKSLQPDEIISVTFQDWNDGRDPAFERAMLLASKLPRG
jgi:hypothetical protein